MSNIFGNSYESGYPAEFIQNSTYYAGPGGGSAVSKRLKPDPSKEYVAGNYNFWTGTIPRVLDQGIDQLTRYLGTRVYEAMMVDADVSSAVNTLKMGVLADEMLFIASVTPDGTKQGEAAQKRATEICEFARRAILGTDRPFPSYSWEMMDMIWRGNKLAEKIYREQTFGEDKGKFVLDRLKFKPRWSWWYVVDPRMVVDSILVRVWPTGEYRRIDRSKFAIGVWDQKEEDPRGNSILRAAFEPWNLKVQTWPIFWKGISQFGTPSIVGECAPEEPDRYALDEDGNEDTARGIVSPAVAFSTELARFQSGTALAIPNGAKVYPLESKQDGKAAEAGMKILKREIQQAILLEAASAGDNGAEAKQASDQDRVGIAVRNLRKQLGETWRQEVFKPLIRDNFGDEDAELFTPCISFGGTEHQDFPGTAGAVVGLWNVGFYAPSTVPALFSKLGLPIPSADEIQSMIDARTAGQKLNAPHDPTNEGDQPGSTKQNQDNSLGSRK